MFVIKKQSYVLNLRTHDVILAKINFATDVACDDVVKLRPYYSLPTHKIRYLQYFWFRT